MDLNEIGGMGLYGIAGTAFSLINNKAFNIGVSNKTAAIFGFVETIALYIFFPKFADGICQSFKSPLLASEMSRSILAWLSIGIGLTAGKVMSVVMTRRLINRICPLTDRQANQLGFCGMMDAASVVLAIYLNWDTLVTYSTPQNTTMSQ